VRRHRLDARSKFCPLFWKLLVSEFLLCMSGTLHCSMSAHLKIVPLLDVHQLLMLFPGTLTYSEPGTFSIVFYNVIIIIIIITVCIYVYMVTYYGLSWRIIMGSRFGDWIYWYFFTVTVDYNCSHIERLLNDDVLRMSHCCLNIGLVSTLLWFLYYADLSLLEFTNPLPFITSKRPS
jgi:hypothetical protein